jgi:hypothetical protein
VSFTLFRFSDLCKQTAGHLRRPPWRQAHSVVNIRSYPQLRFHPQ